MTRKSVADTRCVLLHCGRGCCWKWSESPNKILVTLPGRLALAEHGGGGHPAGVAPLAGAGHSH
eukprot:6083805-Alexandrium_andersonii.AAC.1